MIRRAGLAALTAADAASVWALWPSPSLLTATVAHPRVALAEHGADGALLPVLGALVWAAAAWLAVGLTAAAATRLPGTAGRLAGGLARRLLPRALRAVLSGSAGLGVLLAPAAALAHPAPSAPVPGAALPSPAWPVSSSAATPPAWPTQGVAPSPAKTRSTQPPSPASPPSTPPASHRPPAPAPEPRPTTGRPGPAKVTVHPGDSLWTIAAARLGPGAQPARVAAAWPRWFAANRAVIGDDPTLIRPGQVLRPPQADRHPDSTHRRAQEDRP